MGLLPPPYLVASEPSKPHFCHLEFSKMNYDNAHMLFAKFEYSCMICIQNMQNIILATS